MYLKCTKAGSNSYMSFSEAGCEAKSTASFSNCVKAGSTLP